MSHVVLGPYQVIVVQSGIKNPHGEKGIFICECGNHFNSTIKKVKSGIRRTCNECSKKRVIASKVKHSMSKSPEYKSWAHMKARCYLPTDEKYPSYGERGIKVCDRWIESFSNFYQDMGPKPSRRHSIERKDNNGNYEPGNCVWADDYQQANNKRNNIIFEINGKIQTLPQWCRERNVKYKLVAKRIRLGWNIEDALSIPKLR